MPLKKIVILVNNYLKDKEIIETLWAEDLGNNIYRIDNSPFYAYNISYNDVVEAKENSNDDNRLYFLKVISSSGHSTYRVKIIENKIIDAKPLLSELEIIGCTFEGVKNSLISIDIPPTTKLSEIIKILEHGKTKKIWFYEEAKCAHN